MMTSLILRISTVRALFFVETQNLRATFIPDGDIQVSLLSQIISQYSIELSRIAKVM